jgi:hypothetical protein
LRLDEFRGEIRRRRNEHQTCDTPAFASPLQFFDHSQGYPSTHRRTDEDLRSGRKLPEYCKALLEP